MFANSPETFRRWPLPSLHLFLFLLAPGHDFGAPKSCLSALEGPKRTEGDLQDAISCPDGPQEVPKRSPRGPHEVPRGSEERPKRPQEGPKMHPEG